MMRRAAVAAAAYLLSFGAFAAFKEARPALIKALTFLVELPKRVTDAGALRARKRLEAALALKAEQAEKAKRDAAKARKEADAKVKKAKEEADARVKKEKEAKAKRAKEVKSQRG